MNDPISPDQTHSSLRADFVLTGGTVYDGTGAPGVRADIAVLGVNIVAVAPDLATKIATARRIDVTGLAVAPGFIDIHTHSDLTALSQRDMTSSIHQGVTTELTGNCGMSASLMDGSNQSFQMEKAWLEREGVVADWKRMSSYLERLDAQGVSTNIATLAGHGTIRKLVMGFDERPPTSAELAAMQDLLSKAMDDGAVGLSTGLEYLPGGFADADEIAALAQIAKDAGGFYASHLRNEGDTLLESVEETIQIGERTGIAVQLSHHKSEGKANWGKVKKTLLRMQSARDAGLDVLTDQYPYTAFMTGLSVILLPQWARGGTPDEIQARLADDAQRARIESDIDAMGLDYDLIQIGIARGRPEVQGLTLTQLGKEAGTTPVRAAIELLVAEIFIRRRRPLCDIRGGRGDCTARLAHDDRQ